MIYSCKGYWRVDMLYVFVEGPDDYNYFDKIFGSFFKDYLIVQYAQMTNNKISNFLKSISSMPNADYLFFADEDGKGIDNRRHECLSQYQCLVNNKLYIVQYEIESWYYAGVSQKDCKALKLKNYQDDTNSLTKEQFYAKLLRPSDRKYVMAQMLNCYSKELSEKRNNSFADFSIITKELTAV